MWLEHFPDCNVNGSKAMAIANTSGQGGAQSVTCTASCTFPASDPADPGHIHTVMYEFVNLAPGQTNVPTEPKMNGFGLP